MRPPIRLLRQRIAVYAMAASVVLLTRCRSVIHSGLGGADEVVGIVAPRAAIVLSGAGSQHPPGPEAVVGVDRQPVERLTALGYGVHVHPSGAPPDEPFAPATLLVASPTAHEGDLTGYAALTPPLVALSSHA
jgi:hypothetical protein